jgi:hypothetical protein
MWVIGLICVIVVAIFVPRTILAILGGVVLGGYWWWLFGPLIVVGFILDALAGASLSD